MKKNLLLLILAAGLSGCASFNSGDILVERETARAMLDDKELVPFAALEVSWQNFPYRAATDSIGEGSITNPKKLKPVQVNAEDADAFARRARDIFAKAGLYDRARGRGTLRLELTSFGRWTYSDLWRSFLVDTGFIFILPASLHVNYYLTADFAAAPGPVRVETEARNKTTFHLFMAPLYPFLSPGSREKGLLKQMLWRSATDVYARLKAAGPAADLPPKQAPKDEKPPLGGPPVQPDRTWLPGELPAAGEAPVPAPVKPDQTWAVGQPLPAEVQPAPAPQPQAAPAPAAAPPAADETPDD
ncbi:MAG: hypothetical protein PHV33_07695 [Elusimicrobiales bacterium]|nr:hypothetical protein [Elusimicrobiales bacterium]